ncbi:MAG: addiction module toxin RelE [Rhodanobacter sp.]
MIYYHFVSASRIGLLFAYPKNEQVNLTPAQKTALRKIIELWR